MKSSSEKWNKKLAKILVAGRKKAGLSQGDVSRHFGLTSPQFISNIERGLCVVPLSMLADMVGMYGLRPQPLAELLLKAERERLRSEFLKPAQKNLRKSR